ncbi:MAG: phenylacetate--CoA ligase family protein, partial [Rubrivivax sp.]
MTEATPRPHGRHLDTQETRPAAEREAAWMAALPRLVEQARLAPALRENLQGVDAASVTTREALARLGVTRKPELLERQKAQRATDPFGGYSTIGWRALRGLAGARRVYQSPGP